MFIDSHAHLGEEELFTHWVDVQKRAMASGIELVVDICTNQDMLRKGLSLQGGELRVLLAAATTPHDLEKEGEVFFPEVEKAAMEGKLVAIGETGLDYYYEHSPKELQKTFLLRYFHLAKRTELPMIFHCRDAFEDLFALAKTEYPQGRALVHCFTGNKQEACEALDLGWYISLSGILTFKKSELLREVAGYIPLDRLLLETDAPYLAPKSKRGQTNEPSFLPETAKVLADIKGVTVEEVAYQTRMNTLQFLGC